MFLGAVGGLATSWTGIGAVAGGIAVVYGADVTSSGLSQMLSGEETQTLTAQGISSGLQAFGVEENTANVAANTVDASIGIAMTGLSGNAIPKAAPSFAKSTPIFNQTAEGAVMLGGSVVGTKLANNPLIRTLSAQEVHVVLRNSSHLEQKLLQNQIIKAFGMSCLVEVGLGFAMQ
jgi:hypothetical protein